MGLQSAKNVTVSDILFSPGYFAGRYARKYQKMTSDILKMTSDILQHQKKKPGAAWTPGFLALFASRARVKVVKVVKIFESR